MEEELPFATVSASAKAEKKLIIFKICLFMRPCGSHFYSRKPDARVHCRLKLLFFAMTKLKFNSPQQITENKHREDHFGDTLKEIAIF